LKPTFAVKDVEIKAEYIKTTIASKQCVASLVCKDKEKETNKCD
jgi:hypothetical protein